MYVFRHDKEKMLEKVQFLYVVYRYAATYFETFFNAAMAEKMLRAKLSIDNIVKKKAATDIEFLARLGYWHWDAIYVTVDSIKVGGDNIGGSDFVMGLGGSMQLSQQLNIRLMWQPYAVDIRRYRPDFIWTGV